MNASGRILEICSGWPTSGRGFVLVLFLGISPIPLVGSWYGEDTNSSPGHNVLSRPGFPGPFQEAKLVVGNSFSFNIKEKGLIYRSFPQGLYQSLAFPLLDPLP